MRYEIPIPAPEKLICVGVNFPDRNEEYKDGQAVSSHPSLFVRFPRSFTGHEEPLMRPPESPQLDYEGEIVVVIGRGAVGFQREKHSSTSRRSLCAMTARSAIGCGMPSST
jgi:2-keto-4-pentenoate hydratase/2-oxohepta-3-ene-1,7-dioic acid hydratase in catechol pathway